MTQTCPVCGRPGDTPSGRCSSCVVAHAAEMWQATNAPILLSVTAVVRRNFDLSTGVVCPGCGRRDQDISGLCEVCQTENAVADYVHQRKEQRRRLWDRRQLVEEGVA